MSTAAPNLKIVAVAVLIAALTGCGGWQSVLDPAGPQSGRIASLWWFFVWLLGAIYVIVIAATFFGVFRGRREHTDPAARPLFRRNVTAAVIVTAVILVLLIVVSVVTGKAVSTSLASNQALVIEVTGYQWWWEIRYPDSANASRTLTSANEIHIPVNRPVMLRVTGGDVIHSLWIPNLSGKIDLIPSRTNVIYVSADRPGVFRGQCAEYCGLQHAHMALFVVAESQAEFNRWFEHQLQPAPEPSDAALKRGQQVFLTAPCSMCHMIRGIHAFGQVAPDLTHIGSRRTIGAGTLPNTTGHLAGWVTDSQRVKPGNRMPPISLAPEDLQPLLAYVESLK